MDPETSHDKAFTFLYKSSVQALRRLGKKANMRNSGLKNVTIDYLNLKAEEAIRARRSD